MAIVTSQKINNYYKKYHSIEVTFNKDVIKNTGLQSKSISIKMGETHRPVILYAASMERAKVLISLPEKNLESIIASDKNISLHLSFIKRDDLKKHKVSFFISGRLKSFSSYSNSTPSLYLCPFEFNSTAPDDLIEILGFLLEANINASKRKDERYIVTKENYKEIGLLSKSCILVIENVPRKAIFRDISYSGAKIICSGNSKFLKSKNATLEFQTSNKETLSVKASILRVEAVQDRRDIMAIALAFKTEDLPLEFKLMINNYLFNKT